MRISLAVSLRHLSEQNKAALRLNLRLAAVMLLQLDGQSSCKALSINHLNGAGNRNRTYDLRVTSATINLYLTDIIDNSQIALTLHPLFVYIHAYPIYPNFTQASH